MMLPLNEMIWLIESPNGDKCESLFGDNLVRFKEAWGSSNNHQAWPGGYLDHVTEVMNIAITLHASLSTMRPLPIKLSDALLVLFLHDLEKPWKKEMKFQTKSDRHGFRLTKIGEYGIVLNLEQLNALTYVEGENDSYRNDRRVMNELAAFCHLCDMTSARIWHDQPIEEIEEEHEQKTG